MNFLKRSGLDVLLLTLGIPATFVGIILATLVLTIVVKIFGLMMYWWLILPLWAFMIAIFICLTLGFILIVKIGITKLIA